MTRQIKRTIREIRNKISGASSLSHQLNVIEQNSADMNARLISLTESMQRLEAKKGVQTLRINDTTVLTKIFTDLKMYLNPSDMAVAAHIALDGIWEKEITRAWLTVIKPEYTILDIGANFGYFGLLSGQFTNKKKAKVVMFEANHKLVPYINKSISINWLNEQVKVENVAVGDKPGKVTLSVLEDYIGSSSVQSFEKLDAYMHEKMQLKIREEMTVESLTIDDYCKNNSVKEVNLIKMDIEGYEEKAYAGMRKVISKSKDVSLFIEFTKDGYDNPKAFYRQLLDDFGYVYTIDDMGKIIKPQNNSYENIIEGKDDWVMPIFSKNPSLDKVDSGIRF